MTGSLKKANKPSRSIRSKHIAAATASTRFGWAAGSQAIVLAMICVVVAVALVTARQAPSRAEVTDIKAPRAAVAVSKNTTTQREAKMADIAKASSTTPLEAETESPSQVDTHDAGAVTMTGCLELEDQTLRLADVSGIDAPRSRTWRSGFLRKRPAKIELVDEFNTLRLSNHVGRRIAATGTLVDGEMQVHSLRRVATSCES
jgi:hypothetical protein